MKNAENPTTRGSDCDFDLDRQLAGANLLLRNTRDLRACGLTPEQYDVMLYLKVLRNRERRTLSNLAVRIKTDVVTCTSVLDVLRQRNLVRCRRLSPSQRYTFQLTATGEALLRGLCRRDLDRWRRLAPSLLSTLPPATAQEDCDVFLQDPLS